MAVKTAPQKAKHRKPRPGPPPVDAASTLSVARQNLINMVAVTAVSGTGLLAASHF
jgi:hypothetical protein